MERENVWKKYQKKDEINKVHSFANGYKDFLSNCKTERECTKYFEKKAKSRGFISIEEAIKKNKKLKTGDRIYATNMGKEIALFVIGKEDICNGMNILGAHIDSPRLDLKQNPLYEDSDMALLDTHYYGGIKKYQWVTIPLALHGTIAKTDGTTVDFVIGEKDDDPVFCITDLLIHLSADQMSKEAKKVIEGEDLNVLIGSIPYGDEIKNDKEKKQLINKNVMNIIIEYFNNIDKENGNKKYDYREEDFMSCEVEVVPAGKARDMGVDRRRNDHIPGVRVRIITSVKHESKAKFPAISETETARCEERTVKICVQAVNIAHTRPVRRLYACDTVKLKADTNLRVLANGSEGRRTVIGPAHLDIKGRVYRRHLIPEKAWIKPSVIQRLAGTRVNRDILRRDAPGSSYKKECKTDYKTLDPHDYLPPFSIQKAKIR